MFYLVPFRRRNKDLFKMDDFFNNFVDFNFVNKGLNNFKTDIQETNTEYIVQAELPGLNKKDIDIALDNDYMTITAENNEIIEEEKDNYIRKERRSGKFQRSFNISDVKTDEIQAKYENGILEIKLPKNSEAKNIKRIDIH